MPGSASSAVNARIAGVVRLPVALAVTLASAMFVLPFLWPFHTHPLITFYNEWVAAALLIGICFCLSLKPRAQSMPVFELPAVAPLFLPLMAVILLQWALGRVTYSSDAMLPLLTLVLASAALIAGRALARGAGLDRILLWVSVASIAGGLLNIAVQILQLCATNGIRFAYFNYNSGGQYFGLLAQRNHLATYLAWSVVGTLFLFATRRIGAASLLGLLIVQMAGMSLTVSRTGVLHVLWIGIAGAWMFRALQSEPRPYWRWILGVPVLYGLVNLALPHVLEVFGLSFQSSALQRAAAEGLDGGRRLLYAQGIEMFLAHPFFGLGPGQSFITQFQLLDQLDKTLFATSTHNIILDLLVITGLTGSVPFLVLAGLWLRRVSRPAMTVARAAALLMLSTLAIHAMLELPHWYGFFLLPAALLCGALDPASISLPRGRVLRFVPYVACVYGAAVAMSMWSQYRTLESMFVRLHTKERAPVTVDEKQLARLLAFQRTTWFTAQTEYLVFNSLALNDVALQEKLAIGSRTIQHRPEPHVVYRYVLLLALAGKQDEGVVVLNRTRKMHPEAYEEIASEFVQLADKQPAVFGRIRAALRRDG